VFSVELLPTQNGQPKNPGSWIRFHSHVPAGARWAPLVELSWQYSPTTAVPGFAGSVCTVNGCRKPIAKISGLVFAVPGSNRLPAGIE
jgi:hypothetical protein